MYFGFYGYGFCNKKVNSSSSNYLIAEINGHISFSFERQTSFFHFYCLATLINNLSVPVFHY